MALPSVEEVKAEVETWVGNNWDPDITVGEWWKRLADAKWTGANLPEPWGRGWPGNLVRVITGAIGSAGAIAPPGGLGLMLAAPTIAQHGSEEIKAELLPGILEGRHGWCQMFSEPNAGSDLAGLQTRAELDGDEWVVNGQKVWTSLGQYADYGMLIARTDPDLPKHQGITYFAFPMRQDGVDIRPLREMTGRALFNEVFVDGARVANDQIIGDVGDGWRIANSTLMFERSGIGGSGGGMSAALPGTVSGHLDASAGSFVKERSSLASGGVGRRTFAQYRELVTDGGHAADPTIRQEMAKLYTYLELARIDGLRGKAKMALTGGEGNLGKIGMTRTLNCARELGNRLIGAEGMLFGPEAATGGVIQEMTLFSPAPPIYGGTDEVQRNIIGERVLGLPKG